MTKFSSDSYQTDQTVRPQDDFYAYANNSWLAAHPIPESESRWGTFMQLRDEAWRNLRDIYEGLQGQEHEPDSIAQKVRDFYYAGMHFDEFQEAHARIVEDLFSQIDAATDTAGLSAVIGALHAVGIDGPWAHVVDADNLDSSRHAIRFHQGGLTLPDRDYYLEDSEKMRAIRAKLDEHADKVFSQFAGLADKAAIFDLERGLAQVSRSSVALRDVEANYHRVPFGQLAQDYPAIDWPAYAAALGWKQDGLISIDQPEFFAYVNEQLANRPLNEWKAYLKWRVVMACYGKMSEQLSELKFEFFGKVLSGTSEMMPLWKRVVLAADTAIGEAVGRLYAERHFPESSKQQVLDLVEKMRATYAARIGRLDWMSSETKRYALEKLANIKVLIGYPDTWRDFSGLVIGRDSYLGNVLAADAFDTAYWLARLAQPTSREDWFMDPQTVNAYHDPNRLVICFPAAILQAPFFDPKAHLAANMGGIGTVIGHELTHGFDDQGCLFDADGNVRTWQTEEERTAFSEKAKVIIDQADQFEILPGLNLKGGLIIGESIADLGGLEIAYEALATELGDKLQELADGDLTAGQLFYVNYARTECTHVREEKLREFTLTDPHPASQFRVNGMVRHDDDFYQAFNVTSTDGLYLGKNDRAKIW